MVRYYCLIYSFTDPYVFHFSHLSLLSFLPSSFEKSSFMLRWFSIAASLDSLLTSLGNFLRDFFLCSYHETYTKHPKYWYLKSKQLDIEYKDKEWIKGGKKYKELYTWTPFLFTDEGKILKASTKAEGMNGLWIIFVMSALLNLSI